MQILYFYASPYWNLIYLNKTSTQFKHSSKQLTNVKYENSKLLHAWCSNSYCYRTSSLIKSKVHEKELKNFFPITNIQVGPQLNLWNGYGKGVIRSIDLVEFLQKTCNSLEHCTCNRMTTSTNVAATTRKLFEQNVDMVDVLANGQKRQVGAMIVSSQKKAKGKGVVSQRPFFWLGYHAMNAIACENGKTLEPTYSISELVKFEMQHDEALEHLEAVPSFPYIPQEAWPSKMMDDKEGGHFNLTQVAFDVEINEGGFSLDYQIAVTFELCDRNVSRDEIYTKRKQG